MLENLVAFAGSAGLVWCYYLYLFRQERRHPERVVHTVNRRVREHWVAMVMHSDKQDILAVQTLRNSVMAANFMASTAILLIIGILNLTGNVQKLAAIWQPFIMHEPVSTGLWLVKLSLLLLDYFLAFYYFSMAIRFFNHVGYMINLPVDTAIAGFSIPQVAAYLNRAGSYYSRGTRAFFFSLPLIGWFFGWPVLVIATLLLIVGLSALDRAVRH